MTPEELAQYEANHPDVHGRCPACHYTRQPCAVRELVEEVRRLQASATALEALVGAVDRYSLMSTSAKQGLTWNSDVAPAMGQARAVLEACR